MTGKFRKLLMVALVAASLLGGHQAFPGPVHALEGVNRLGSVGLQVVPTSTGELAILRVPAGTPAAKAGLRPGDLIVQIDGFPLVGSDFAAVVSQHLWGVEGSSVTIHYLRPGEAGRRSSVLRRVAGDPKLTVSPTVNNGMVQPGGTR